MLVVQSSVHGTHIVQWTQYFFSGASDILEMAPDVEERVVYLLEWEKIDRESSSTLALPELDD